MLNPVPSLFPSSYLRYDGWERQLGGSQTQGNTHRFYDSARGLKVFAKAAHPRFPFGQVNEGISYALANMLGLPVPEQKLFTFRGEVWSGSYETETTRLGDLDKAAAFACPVFREEMARGLVFDLLILNPDRHQRNFFVVEDGGVYRPIFFDFDQAVLGFAMDGRWMLERLVKPASEVLHKNYLAMLDASRLTLSQAHLAQFTAEALAVQDDDIQDLVHLIPADPVVTSVVRAQTADRLVRAKLTLPTRLAQLQAHPGVCSAFVA